MEFNKSISSVCSISVQDMLRLIIEITCLDNLSLGSYDSTEFYSAQKTKSFSSSLDDEITRCKVVSHESKTFAHVCMEEKGGRR